MVESRLPWFGRRTGRALRAAAQTETPVANQRHKSTAVLAPALLGGAIIIIVSHVQVVGGGLVGALVEGKELLTRDTMPAVGGGIRKMANIGGWVI